MKGSKLRFKLQEELKELKKFVLRQSYILQSMHDLIIELNNHIASSKDKDSTEMILKSVRQRLYRATKSLVRIQKKLSKKAYSVLELLDLLKSNPSLKTKIEDLFQKITIYHNSLIEASSVNGKIMMTITVGDFKKAQEEIVFTIKQGTEPFLATIDNGQELLEKNEEALVSNDNLNINLDEAFDKNGINTRSVLVLVDTNFAKAISESQNKLKKRGIDLITHGNLIIPTNVFREMTHKPFFVGSPLVPRALANYFKSLGTRIEDVEPTQDEIEFIVSFWRRTGKGRNASEDAERKFKEQGDMSILVRAIREQRKDVVILTDDNDIIQTIMLMHKAGKALNVRIYNYKNQNLALAA